MAKLRNIMTRRKDSKGMYPKRFYTSRDMSEIKHSAAIKNAQIKRGELIDKPNNYISVCGCGFEGCFIHGSYDTLTPEENAAWQLRKEAMGLK